MDAGLETVVDRSGADLVIRIMGDLSAAAQEPLAAAVTAAQTAELRRIVLVFRETDHINSAGVGVLIGLTMDCRKHDRTVCLVHPSPHFRRIFEMVGLTRYLRVFTDLAEALAGSA